MSVIFQLAYSNYINVGCNLQTIFCVLNSNGEFFRIDFFWKFGQLKLWIFRTIIKFLWNKNQKRTQFIRNIHLFNILWGSFHFKLIKNENSLLLLLSSILYSMARAKCKWNWYIFYPQPYLHPPIVHVLLEWQIKKSKTGN